MQNPKRRRSTNEEKEIAADLNCTNKYIPADVTAEILSRLPTKSIGRFTSVSKSWRDIIMSRGFTSMRAKNTPFSAYYAATPFYHYIRRKGHNMVEVSETGEHFRTSLRPKVRGSSKSSKTLIVGSCNGLLCLLQRKHDAEVITISNPLTNESTAITLPNHGDWINGSYREKDVARRHYAFGYSPSTNEHKVFKVLAIRRGAEVHISCAIFTVGVEGRWRDLPLAHSFLDTVDFWDGKVVLCNGAFHWLVVRYGDGQDPTHHYIIALDIARESTRRIPIRMSQWCLRLLVLNNCLCLCSNMDCYEVNTTVWKMEDCESDGWRSGLVVPKFSFPVTDDVSGYEAEIFVPVNYATKRGSILFKGKRYGHLRLYCPEQKRHTATIRVSYENRMMLGFTPTFLSIDEIVRGESSSTSARVVHN